MVNKYTKDKVFYENVVEKDLKSEWLFDDNLGEESELADEVVIWKGFRRRQKAWQQQFI